MSTFVVPGPVLDSTAGMFSSAPPPDHLQHCHWEQGSLVQGLVAYVLWFDPYVLSSPPPPPPPFFFIKNTIKFFL